MPPQTRHRGRALSVALATLVMSSSCAASQPAALPYEGDRVIAGPLSELDLATFEPVEYPDLGVRLAVPVAWGGDLQYETDGHEQGVVIGPDPAGFNDGPDAPGIQIGRPNSISDPTERAVRMAARHECAGSSVVAVDTPEAQLHARIRPGPTLRAVACMVAS